MNHYIKLVIINLKFSLSPHISRGLYYDKCRILTPVNFDSIPLLTCIIWLIFTVRRCVLKNKFALTTLLLLSSSYVYSEDITLGIVVPSEESFKDEISMSKKEIQEVLGDDYTITSNIITYSSLEDLKVKSNNIESTNNVVLPLDPLSSKVLRDDKSSSIILNPFANQNEKSVECLNRLQDIHSFKSITLVTSKDVDDVFNISKSIEEILNVDVKVDYIEDLDIVSTDAILIYNPTRINESKVSKLIRDNLDEGIPSFSFMSKRYVDEGALAGIIIDKSENRSIRESALSLEEKLENKSYSKEVYEHNAPEPKFQIVYNLTTSKRLKSFPKSKALEGAIFTGSYLGGSEDITFAQAIDIAVDNNLVLRSKAYYLDAFSYNPKRAKAKNRPEVNAFSRFTNQNDTYSEYSVYDAENTLRGGVRVKQSIFNDDIWKDIYVQEKAFESEKENYRRDKVNTIFLAGSNYLDILSSKASLNIEKYNLDLTRSFLKIAQNRKDVGISDSSDVFRLESLYAQSETKVRAQQGALEKNQRELNQTLNLPLETKFDYSSMTLENEAFMASNNGFLEIIKNPLKTQELINFLNEKFVEEIPEVKSMEYGIQGKERELKTASRRRYTPNVALEAESSWDLKDPWGENSDNKDKEDYWRLGVGFELPLYKGGDISYEKSQLTAELNSLKTNKKAIIEDFNRLISNSVTNLSTSYRALLNAQKSTEASEKNLDLVTDNYAKGTVSITNLLDARTDAINSKQEEVIATYTFLTLLLELERTIGEFYFNKDDSLKGSLDNEITRINSTGRK